MPAKHMKRLASAHVSSRGGLQRRAVVSAALLLALTLGGCASGIEGSDTTGSSAEQSQLPRVVNTEEAQRLAVMRFNNFNAGTRFVSFEATESSVEYSVDGRYDYVTHTGIGVLTDAAGSSILIIWSPAHFGVHHNGDTVPLDGKPPETIPDMETLDTAWSIDALNPSGSVLHAVLAAVAALGNDRPENPLLVQQAGALTLGSGDVAGIAATHFAGPASDEPTSLTDPAELAHASKASYWLDDANLLLRAELRVGGGPRVTTVNFDTAEASSVPSPFDASGTTSNGGSSES